MVHDFKELIPGISVNGIDISDTDGKNPRWEDPDPRVPHQTDTGQPRVTGPYIHVREAMSGDW